MHNRRPVAAVSCSLGEITTGNLLNPMSLTNTDWNVINVLGEWLSRTSAPPELVNQRLARIGNLAMQHDPDRQLVAFRFANGGAGVLYDFRKPVGGLPELARRVTREWVLRHMGQAFAQHDPTARNVYDISSDKVTANNTVAAVAADLALTAMRTRERPFDYMMTAVAELHRTADILISVANDLERLFERQFDEHSPEQAAQDG